ncbi:MAG: carbonic anhydrase family protein [Rhodocyclales bacterium]|nr:carbonic anhydrase family protein [Rhodocyclales bacterium]
MIAAPGSADDLLLKEACKPRTVAEGRKVAEDAARVAVEANEGKPTVMYADMRSADLPVVAKPRQVADKVPDGRPVDVKSAEKAAEKPAENKTAERPRYIELPKIDKSKLEETAATAKPADAKPADAKAAPKTVAAKGERPERATEIPAASRHELERQYATSGPRRSTRSKAAEQAAAAAAAAEHRDIHWSYEGEGGPTNWSKLRADYATCGSGRRQSPIDLRESIKVDLEPIQFDYKMTQFTIVDNGHTVQVNVGEGSTIRVMEREFQLVQFHFHRPAEERIGGRAFDMVVHLVHKDIDGRLAVIAVLLERGSEHPLVQTVWNAIPLERNSELTPSWILDLNQLLPPPERRAYFTYMGSLTTPPCTEDVLWMVFKQPLQVSSQQIGIFSRLYPNNARPVQPSNGRLVKESR